MKSTPLTAGSDRISSRELIERTAAALDGDHTSSTEGRQFLIELRGFFKSKERLDADDFDPLKESIAQYWARKRAQGNKRNA